MTDLHYPCPICKTVTLWANNAHRPFCSERCKLIDLGEWASDGYIVSGNQPSDTENWSDTQSTPD